MPQIEFTKDEYELLARSAEKLMAIRRDLPPQQWRKPQHRAIKDFAKRFNMEPELASDVTRILGRPEIRLIQELATAAADALATSIIPSYNERISKAASDVKKVEYYTPYLQKAEKTKSLYDNILKKLEDSL